jgi:hypothetical protein
LCAAANAKVPQTLSCFRSALECNF